MENKIGRNGPSPKNEDDFISAYLNQNPKAKKHDGMDIAAVILTDGTKGHGLLPENINRGHDNNYHVIKDFIPDSELKN